MVDPLREAHAHLEYALKRLGTVPAEKLPASLVQAAEVLRTEVYEMFPPGVEETVVIQFPKRGKYK